MDDPWGSSPWADDQHLPNESEVKPGAPAKSTVLDDKVNDPWASPDNRLGNGERTWTSLHVEPQIVGRTTGFDGANELWDRIPYDAEQEAAKSGLNGVSILGSGSRAAIDGAAPVSTTDLVFPESTLRRQPSLGFDAGDVWGTSAAESLIEVDDNGTKSGALLSESAPADHGKTAQILSPSEKDKTPEARKASPDPWATTVTSSDGLDATISNTNNLSGTSSDRVLAMDRGTDEILLKAAEPTPEGQDITLSSVPSIEVLHDNHALDTVELPQEKVKKTYNISNTQYEDHNSSRPSSSSDDSLRGKIVSESPRTSLDEDARRPAVPRKVSSKIKELVTHFDGLAKSAEEESPISAISRTPSRNTELVKKPPIAEEKVEEPEKGDESEEFGDFGEFEDGDGDFETFQASNSEPPAALGSSEAQIPAPSPKETPLKDFGRVEYRTPASVIDQLFPNVEAESVEKVFIPDTLPSDSFASVEQRKIWYRVSRYGPMRKYNSGADDNYVRVSWQQSQIRRDTLKIVGKWMEEDRISGRVALGGASRGSSVFGWNDSNATPVSLDSIFASKAAKRKSAPLSMASEVPREWSKQHTKSHSTSSPKSPPEQRRRSSKSSKASQEAKSPIKSPVASFSWNSDSAQEKAPQAPIALSPKFKPANPMAISPAQQPAFQVPAASPTDSPFANPPPASHYDFDGFGSSKTSAILDITSRKSAPSPLVIPPPVPISTTFESSDSSGINEPASHKTAIPFTAEALDDDDEWGEMVASPVISAPPTFPPHQILRHKKSQSLTGGHHFQTSQTSSKPHVPSPLSGSGHRPTSSLGELLVPKDRTFTPASDPFNLDAFGSTSATSDPWGHFSSPASIGSNAVPNVSAVFPASSFDPWASADFSIFESTPAASPPKPTQAVAPSRGAPIKVPSKPAVPKPQTTAPTPPRGNGKTREEVEQDRIVAKIVKGLPNLSYMFRR